MDTKRDYDTREVTGMLWGITVSLFIMIPPLLWGQVITWPLGTQIIYFTLLTVFVVSGLYLGTRHVWYFLITLPRETRRINAELEEESKRLRAINARNPKNKERNTRRRRKKRK